MIRANRCRRQVKQERHSRDTDAQRLAHPIHGKNLSVFSDEVNPNSI